MKTYGGLLMASAAILGETVALREHATPLGALWSCWTPRGLYRLGWYPPQTSGEFGAAGVFDSAEDETEIDSFDQQLQRFFSTGQVSFAHVRLDFRGWSDFAQRVYQCCRQIPVASTWTYRQLAVAAGSPKASRAVGAAMARNRVPLVVPCHRVISSGGALRGFSAPGGLETKQRLLQLERDGKWPASCG